MIALGGGRLGAKEDTTGAEDNPEAGRLTWPLVIKLFPSCFPVVTGGDGGVGWGRSKKVGACSS